MTAPTTRERRAEIFGPHLEPAPRPSDKVTLVRPDGTSGTIEADALRALAGYIEQRDAGSAS